MRVFYRIAESTNPEHDRRRTWQQKPVNATKRHCLELALLSFPTAEFTIYVDGITPETFAWLKSLESDRIHIKKIEAGSEAKSFRILIEDACLLADNEIVLLQEDDYLYLPGGEVAITEALQYANYATCYLHPSHFDLPQRGGNIFVTQQNVSEVTRVVRTNSRMWMMTNSTTCTFAAKAKTLKEDKAEWFIGTSDLIGSKDFDTFITLRKKGRSVLMPIPSLSTHALRGYEAPLVGTGLTSWEQI